jgi:hypothetical protein
MAVRVLSASGTTLVANSNSGALLGARGASDKILFVSQTGAVQGQRESSTELHTKCGLYRAHRARENCARALPSLGGDFVARRESGVVRTGRRLGD